MENKTFADKSIQYFTGLSIPHNLPNSIEILNPYLTPEVKNIVAQFYSKFFNDFKKRIYILGINPGRFGGGLTGISFTDPVALREKCGIDNTLSRKKELSSEFIYNVIDEYGGTDKFFSGFFLSALYPLAITKAGKNYNFYDDPVSFKYFLAEIKNSLKKQVTFGASKTVICLGLKNYQYLNTINEELKLFDTIKVLDHPRYIMQYKRKKLKEYLINYLTILNELNLQG